MLLRVSTMYARPMWLKLPRSSPSLFSSPLLFSHTHIHTHTHTGSERTGQGQSGDCCSQRSISCWFWPVKVSPLLSSPLLSFPLLSFSHIHMRIQTSHSGTSGGGSTRSCRSKCEINYGKVASGAGTVCQGGGGGVCVSLKWEGRREERKE